MPWPLSQDYNEAIQNPQTSFADPELRAGQVVTNAMGLPMPRSGNFADVYEFIGASGTRWALKFFTREVPGLQERYARINKHLAQLKLPFTIDFDYLGRGIRIRGQFYPVLKMTWVDGFLLNEFVSDNLDRPHVLDALGQIWVRMAQGLRDAGIAHADLQHGNVILAASTKANTFSVKLIDYDGMWVPALANNKSGEVGHANYQHPQRLKNETYSADVDRVPLLCIACALRALTVAGKALWDRYDNGDNLLFREVDLREPGQSALFKQLWNLPDEATHDLAGWLVLGLIGQLEYAPLLANLVIDDNPKPLTRAQEQQVTAILGPGATFDREVDSRPFQTAPASIQARPVKMPSPAAELGNGPMAAPSPPAPSRGMRNILIGMVGVCVLAMAVGVGIFMTRTGDEPQQDEQQNSNVVPNPEPQPENKPKLLFDPWPLPGPKLVPDPKPKLELVITPQPEPKLELPAVKAGPWDHLDISYSKSMDGYLRIDPMGKPPPEKFDPLRRISTKASFSGPLEIDAVARTAKDNIRLDGPGGSMVIFNLDGLNDTLVIHRPHGRPTGSKGTVSVGFKSLIADRWYSLKWLVTENGMHVFVDKEKVYTEIEQYKFDAAKPVGISAVSSVVDVKSFTVKPAANFKFEPDPPAKKPAETTKPNIKPKALYLSQMPEFGLKVSKDKKDMKDRFGKNGKLGYTTGGFDSISVNGKDSPHGLSMHPAANSEAIVKYKLGRTAQTLLASVAVNDSAVKIQTALIFQVFGDGKPLWTSSTPMSAPGSKEDCKVKVAGVNILELRVVCPGTSLHAHAVWLEPRVVLKQPDLGR